MYNLTVKYTHLMIGSMTALIACAPAAQENRTSGLLAVGQQWHYEGKFKRDIYIDKLDYSAADGSFSAVRPPDTSYPNFTALGFIPGNQPGTDALAVATLPPAGDGLACIVRNVLQTGTTLFQGYEFVVMGNDIAAVSRDFIEKGDSTKAIGTCQISRLK